MKQYRVGIIGCTGMVGQRFATILENHPWFTVTALAASARSAGKTYEEAVGCRWAMKTPLPSALAKMPVYDAEKDIEKIVSLVDFVFCAVNMKKEEIRALEETYARHECPVVSNNSAHRSTPDVPMIIPEINADHAAVIDAQRKRLGTKRGFIAVKCNCSLQSYVPAIHPLLDLGEPLKIWGHVENGVIVNTTTPSITSQCLRVPVSDGHMAAVFFSLENKISKEEIIERWEKFRGPAQELELPSAPKQFLHYFTEDNRPQPKLDRDLEGGMAVSIGRLRPDTQYDYKFVCLSHNTLRGAAGGALLMAELLAAKGYFD